MPLGVENDYGRKYAQLYAALGFRSLHPGAQRPGGPQEPASGRHSAEQELGGQRLPQSADGRQHRASRADADARTACKDSCAFSTTATRSPLPSGCSCAVQNDIDAGRKTEKENQAHRTSVAAVGRLAARPTGRTFHAQRLLAGEMGSVQSRPHEARQQRGGRRGQSPPVRRFAAVLRGYRHPLRRRGHEGGQESAGSTTCCAGRTTRAIPSTIRTARCT